MAKGKPMSKLYKTGQVKVSFSHLDKLDRQFDKDGNHNITVSVNSEMKKVLNKMHTEFGKDRSIAGNKVSKEYGEQQTFKTTLHRNQTKFPEIYNHLIKKEEGLMPDWGDTVNVAFIAKETDVNNAKWISMYLHSVQVIESNGGGDDCVFDEVVVADDDDELMKILNAKVS
tara:strand:+ start:583 stop:1095 length:513 start_codon:yes stop_codon:yes gene_type:complete